VQISSHRCRDQINWRVKINVAIRYSEIQSFDQIDVVHDYIRSLIRLIIDCKAIDESREALVAPHVWISSSFTWASGEKVETHMYGGEMEKSEKLLDLRMMPVLTRMHWGCALCIIYGIYGHQVGETSHDVFLRPTRASACSSVTSHLLPEWAYFPSFRLCRWHIPISPVCTFPPEYCEFGSSLTRCKEWLQGANSQLFDKYYSDGKRWCRYYAVQRVIGW